LVGTNTRWFYSNGHEIDDLFEDIEEYNILSARTTIASSKFVYYDSGRGTPTVKTLTLTAAVAVNLSIDGQDLTSATKIELYRDANKNTLVAKSGSATVSNDGAGASVTFTLIKGWKNESWKGEGLVYVFLSIDGSGGFDYFYETNGSPDTVSFFDHTQDTSILCGQFGWYP